VARHGADGTVVDSFTLKADNGDALPAMLDRGVDRIDRSYTRALQEGAFRADKSLVIETPAEEVPINDVLAEIAAAATATITVQAETPDAAALRGMEAGLRAMTGVTGVQTGSLALGGISVFRVSFSGPPAAFREALAARGWQVEDAAGGLRIRRGGVTPPAQ
jgi:hypothetical protein